MKTKCLAFTSAAILFNSVSAIACSCPLYGHLSETEQIDQELKNSIAVFVAKVATVTQMPQDSEGKSILEDAQFVVLEVFKGAIKAGTAVRIHSHVGSGLCGKSARNDPSWLEVSERGKPDTMAKFSDTWLIYAHGSEPFELSFCDRSFPMNLRGNTDATYLRNKPRT